MLGHQAKEPLHVRNALFNFSIEHTQKVQRNVELNEKGIDQHQISQGHDAGLHARHRLPDHEGGGYGDDRRLPDI